MSRIDESRPFIPVTIAVLTVSDTRTLADDKSGDTRAGRIEAAGHRVGDRAVVRDDADAIEAHLRRWIADPGIDCVITTGGTGITGRDVTPEAFGRVLEKTVEGFGELFRMLSFSKIGTSSAESRAAHTCSPCPAARGRCATLGTTSCCGSSTTGTALATWSS